MVAPTEKYVEVNGVNISNYVKGWENDEEWGQIVASINLLVAKSVDEVLSLTSTTPLYPVIVKRGPVTGQETTIFNGYLINHDVSGGMYKLYCSDKMWKAIKTNTNTSFDIAIDPEAGKPSEIYKTLINTYLENMTADASSIQDSGNAFTLKKFVCIRAQLYERLNDLAVAMNWQHYYNPRDDKPYFEPKGYVQESTILEVGRNVSKLPIWNINKNKLFNKITIIGAEQEAQTVQFFSGTGAQKEFVLTYVPTSVEVYVGSTNYDPFGTGTKPSTTPSNLKKGGRVGGTVGSFDYEYDDDAKARKVKFLVAPPAFTRNIEIRYSYKLPAPVSVRNQTSIELYGEIEKIDTNGTVKTIEDAEVYGRNQIAKYSTPFLSATLFVSSEEDIRIGRAYRCVDKFNNVDSYLVVTKIKRVYPFKPDEVTVGDEIARTEDWGVTMMDRVKRLEEKEGKTSDLVVEVIDYRRKNELRRRYGEIYKTNVAGLTMVWGNPEFAVWGTSVYGIASNASFVLGNDFSSILGVNTLGDTTSAPKLAQVWQGNNEYREYFKDDKFIETTTLTAELDTTNAELR